MQRLMAQVLITMAGSPSPFMQQHIAYCTLCLGSLPQLSREFLPVLHSGLLLFSDNSKLLSQPVSLARRNRSSRWCLNVLTLILQATMAASYMLCMPKAHSR